ncbi:MAG: hypothetical protein Q8O86_01130 [Dehalococcoidia bacterium]|nr:hypothetical protein [Dehalococcoidia bacterium]
MRRPVDGELVSLQGGKLGKVVRRDGDMYVLEMLRDVGEKGPVVVKVPRDAVHPLDEPWENK